MPHKKGLKKSGMSEKTYAAAMKKEMKKPSKAAMRTGSVRAGMESKKKKK